MNRLATVSSSEISRAIKATKKAGEPVYSVEIKRDGTVIVHTHAAAPKPEKGPSRQIVL